MPGRAVSLLAKVITHPSIRCVDLCRIAHAAGLLDQAIQPETLHHRQGRCLDVVRAQLLEGLGPGVPLDQRHACAFACQQDGGTAAGEAGAHNDHIE